MDFTFDEIFSSKQQWNNIYNFIKKSITSGTPQLIYINGHHGVGKTERLRKFLLKLQEEIKFNQEWLDSNEIREIDNIVDYLKKVLNPNNMMNID